MNGQPSTLTHELWEMRDGNTLVCFAGPMGDSVRAALPRGARLAWVFDATDRVDAIALVEDRLEGVSPTTCALPDGPYLLEWATQQAVALAATLGDRDTIANSAAAQAWHDAAADLGIRFNSPFPVEYLGTTYWCAGRLPDFGGPKGTIIAGRFSLDDVFDAARARGFYSSGLSPYSYETYDRELFAATLNDWGWFADPSIAPAWFDGAFGKHGGRT
jgi:hypothetical protein